MNHTGAIACVCRDHSGILMDGFSGSVPASSPLLVESDCLVLVEIVNHRRLPPWDCRALFADAAALIPCFSQPRIQHCRREANSIADWAAKAHGRGILSPKWASSPPQLLLLDLLCTDAIHTGCNFYLPRRDSIMALSLILSNLLDKALKSCT